MSTWKRLGLGCCVAALLGSATAPAQAGQAPWGKGWGNWIHWLPVTPDANATTEVTAAGYAYSTYHPASTWSGRLSRAQSSTHAHPKAASTTWPSFASAYASQATQSSTVAYPAYISQARTTFSGFTIGAATATGAVWPSHSPAAVSASSPSVSAPISTYSAPTPVLVATPYPAPSAVSTVSVASLPAPSPAPASAASSAPDGFINLTGGSFIEASTLTTGGAVAWYNSAAVKQVYGGNTPTAQQQADFSNAVLQDVQKTFQLAGLTPKLTLDPNAHASHTLSVVSGASYGGNGNAIGITDVGANGFGFIDKLSYADSPDQLAWAVAHNVSHELMHAFGVGVHHDTTGAYLDSGTASWSMLTDPNATFSAAASADIKSQFLPGTTISGGLGAEVFDLMPSPVPEPATIAAWSLGLAAALVVRGRARGRRSPAR